MGETVYRDFAKENSEKRRPKKAWPILALTTFFLLILTLLAQEDEVRASISLDEEAIHEEWIAAELPLSPTEAEKKSVLLRRGDNAFNAIVRLGFSSREAARIVAAASKVYDLKNVVAGRSIVRATVDGSDELFYSVDKERLLHVQQKDGQWQAKLAPRIAATRRVVLAGMIRDNLFEDASLAGLDDSTTMNLVDIFSWDIDFARDLRRGDSFKVLVEERFDHAGELVDRVILAAEFVNQGHVYRAIRFSVQTGRYEYFSPDGKSMRKAYLRAPVKYTRISSRFHLRRKHPILGYTRAHRGVDYAAPMGTPVRAVGDGTVVYAGWRGGYGRLIRIRHVNRDHETYYAHLSRFAHGMRRGKRVHQGQIIGYVGMSGLATGPHLHFEFRVRGKAINPLHVHRSPANPVPSQLRAAFERHKHAVMQSMSYASPTSSWS